LTSALLQKTEERRAAKEVNAFDVMYICFPLTVAAMLRKAVQVSCMLWSERQHHS
jgi:hypothetical protein